MIVQKKFHVLSMLEEKEKKRMRATDLFKVFHNTEVTYRTTSFRALSSFSATPRLVRPPKTKNGVIVRPLV